MTGLDISARRSAVVGSVLGFWAELQTNRRAAAGLLLIAALVAGYGMLSLDDATARLRSFGSREHLRLQRIVEIGQERDWPERVTASARRRQALEARPWAAESEGVARADIQDWISGIGREVGLPMLDIRIELTKPAALPPGLRQITATITAQPVEEAVTAMLDRIERAPHLIVVDRLNLKQQPAPFLEMVLVSYARISDAQGVAGGPAK
jgi:hypothetical protein